MHFNNNTDSVNFVEESQYLQYPRIPRLFLSRRLSRRKIAITLVGCVAVVVCVGLVWYFAEKTNTESELNIIYQYASSTPGSTRHASTSSGPATKERIYIHISCDPQDLLDVKEHVNGVREYLFSQYEEMKTRLDSLESFLQIIRQQSANATSIAQEKFESMLTNLRKNATEKNVIVLSSENARKWNGSHFEATLMGSVLANTTTLDQQVAKLVNKELRNFTKKTQSNSKDFSHLKNVTNKLSEEYSRLKKVLENSTTESILALEKTLSRLGDNLTRQTPVIFRKIQLLERTMKMAISPNISFVEEKKTFADLCNANDWESVKTVDRALARLRTITIEQCLHNNDTALLRLDAAKQVAKAFRDSYNNFTSSLAAQRLQLGTLMRSLVSTERSARTTNFNSLQNIINTLQKSHQNLVTRQMLSAANRRIEMLHERVEATRNATKDLQEKLTRKLNRGWVQAPNGYAYAMLDTKTSWYGAIERCVSMQAHLAYVGIRDADVQKYIYETLIRPLNRNVWIGLENNIPTRNWKWLDGQQLSRRSSNWARGQPSMYNREQACVVITPFLGNWNDLPCGSNTMYALCEKQSSL